MKLNYTGELTRRGTKAAVVALTVAFATSAEAAFNSGTVTTRQTVPLSTISEANWSVVYGGATQTTSLTAAPTGEPVMEYEVTTPGSIRIENQFPAPADLRARDCFSMIIGESQTRIGDFTYLIDKNHRRRWFKLNVRAWYGFQQPVYFINSYLGQDAGFDLSSVVAVRFGQAGLQVGDKIWIGAVRFENDLVSHAEVAGPWIVDMGQGTISASRDAAEGTFSIRADLTANDQGQADIALDARGVKISWNWSKKSFISFKYKNSEERPLHYFLIYDANGWYREWVFTNPHPGQWIDVTADLRDVGYTESGPVDLSKIVYFEVGVFGGTPGGSYSFNVDEVTVH